MGATHRWTVGTDQQHVVSVEHATHSGRVKLNVDGCRVFEQSDSHALWDTGFDHEFLIENHRCRLRIGFSSGKARCDLWVDGKLQEE